MRKQLKLSGAAYRRLKANRKKINKICQVHRCICKGRKNRKSKWWQRWRRSGKSKTHNREYKTRPISVCECL